ncbi:MAG: POTRA domain-containing protein [Myxococcota bacterium]
MGIALCVAAALLAQAPEIEGEGGRLAVSSVEVRLPAGADPKLLERVPSLVAVRQGQAFSRRAVQRTIENLYATGRFSDVEVTGQEGEGGLALVIELTPRRSVLEVYAEGASALTPAEVVEASRLTQGAEYWPERVARAAEKVVERYGRRGYREAQVEPRVEDLLEGETEGVTVGFVVREGPPLRLSGVSWVGEPGLELSRLREVLGISPGDVLDLEVVEKGLGRVRALFQRERFYRARVGSPTVQDDGRLLLPVVSGPRFELTFSGNRHFADVTLAAVLAYKGEELLDTMMAGRLAQRLELFYRYRGFHDVRVTTGEVIRPGTRSAGLGFVIEEGEPLRVSSLDFDGNTAVSDSVLRDVLVRVMEATAPQVGFDVHPLGDPQELQGRGARVERTELPAPAYDTVLVEEAWAEATRAMTALYRQRGYLSSAVTLDQVVIEGRDAKARFKVVEGPQARFESLEPKGLPEGFSSEVVKRVEKGSPFSLQELDTLRQALARELGRSGFLFAQVAASYRLSEDGKRADAVLAVEPGPLVRVRAILPVGNQRTYDDVVLRQATMVEGQPLDAEALAKTQANLMGLGIFRSVEVEMLAPERPEPLKTVLLKARERGRVSGEFGVGYFLADGPRIVVDLSAPNLGGRAINLNFHGQVNFFAASAPALSGQVDVSDLAAYEQIGGRANLSVSSRSVLPKGFGVRLDGIFERVFRQQFRFTRFAAVPTIDWQKIFDVSGSDWLKPKLTLALQYELDWSRVLPTGASVDPTKTTNVLDQERLRFLFGEFFLQTVRFSPTLDLRDSAANPRKGLLLQGAADLTGAISAVDENDNPVVVNFMKFSGLATGYVPLGSLFTLALSVRAGRIVPLSAGSTTPPVKRFFLGGATSMRGFNEDQLLAEDSRSKYRQEVRECEVLASKDGCSSAALTIREGRQVPSEGGELFALLKAEVRFPAFGALDLGVFFETGNLWLAVPSSLWPFRAIAGGGLRYQTPVGPLALDIGFNISPDRVINEPSFVIHFNIGVF